MKINIFLGCMLLLFMFTSKSLFAQNKHHIPFKNGHWFYTIGQIDAITEISCVEIESLKDSIIEGESVNIFDVYRKRGNNERQLISKEFILEKNDTIWVKEPNTSNFWPLYSFLSNIGDTFYISKTKFKPSMGFFSLSKDSLGPLKYLVVSKDSIWIGGNYRRRIGVLDFQNDNELNWCFGLSDIAYFIDGIGSTTYFFGQSKYVTAATNKTNLRCFNQDSISIKFNNNSESCDYSILLGINKQERENFKISFSNEKIELVEPFKNNYSYRILSLSGLELRNGKVEGSILLNELPIGIYVFQLLMEKQSIYTYKFFKQ